MRSGLYKYLKLDQSQSEDIRLRNKAVVCPFLFFRAAKNAAVSNCATDKPYDIQHMAAIRSCTNCKCTTLSCHATIHLYYVRVILSE